MRWLIHFLLKVTDESRVEDVSPTIAQRTDELGSSRKVLCADSIWRWAELESHSAESLYSEQPEQPRMSNSDTIEVRAS